MSKRDGENDEGKERVEGATENAGEVDAGEVDAGEVDAEDIADLLTVVQLEHCVEPWLDAIEGRRSIEEAARLARERGDPEVLVEQSEVLFTPLTELERARQRRDLVEQFGRASGGRWPLWLAAVAVAAMALLVLAWPRGSGDGDGGRGMQLARYGFDVVGQQQIRSSAEPDEGVVELHEGIELELVAEPEQVVEQAVELRLFGRAEGEALQALEVSLRAQAGGRRFARVTPEQLGLTPGRWELVLVVGPRGSVSDDPAAYSAGAEPPEGVQVLRRRVDVHGAPATTTARVEIRGCESVGPWRCVVAPGSTLRLWIEQPGPSDAEVRINGQPVEAEIYGPPTGDAAIVGAGFRVPIPAVGSAEHRRLATAEGALGERHWVMTVEHPQRDADWILPLQIGTAYDLGGELGELRSRLTDHARQARRAMEEGRWADSLEQRLASMEQSLAHGYWTRAVQDGTAAHFLALRLERPALADRLLGELTPLLAHDPVQRGNLRWAQGYHARRRGDITQAAPHLLEATRLALGLEDQHLAAASLPLFVRTLIDLGHYEQAHQWSTVAVEMSQDYEDCPRAAMLRYLGWSGFLLQQLDEPHAQPWPLLIEALRIYEQTERCSARHERASTRVSLALVSMAAGDADEAERWLEGLEVESLTALQSLWVADTRLRIALARDPPQAQPMLDALAEATAEHASPEARWRLAEAEAELAEARGQFEEAIAAHARAEDELDAMLGRWALGAELDLFTAQRLASAQGLVRLLVEHGRSDQALCAARRSRARNLWAAVPTELDGEARARLDALRQRYIQERAAHDEYGRILHTLPRRQRELELRRLERQHDELTADLRRALEPLRVSGEPPRCDERMYAPEPGEVIATIFPVGPERWAVFAADAQGVGGELVEASTAERGVQRLLGVFDDQIERADRVRVIAAGSANDVAVHVQAWREQPLMSSKTVVYAADLPVGRDRAEGGTPTAVLIEDPTGTLLTATGPELDDASAQLVARGWSVKRLRGEQASATRVLGVLGKADLLHFAGHGDVQLEHAADWTTLAGGAAGWSTYLDLGQGSRLDVHEVLASPRVPRTVVLSGCRTGLVDARSLAGGMSLAMAFLVAGSERVISATEVVGNEYARQVIGELYRSGVLLGGGVVDHGTAPMSAWSKVRVWVR